MLVQQVDVFPVTLAESVVLTIRESNTFSRFLYFRNLTTATLSIKVEKSDDGGATWTTDIASFDLDSDDIANKVSTATGLLRIKASGIADDRGLSIGYVRQYLDAQHIWGSPLI